MDKRGVYIDSSYKLHYPEGNYHYSPGQEVNLITDIILRCNPHGWVP